MASITFTLKTDRVHLSTLEESASKYGFKYNILSANTLIVHSSDQETLKTWSGQFENNEDLAFDYKVVNLTNRVRKSANGPHASFKNASVSYFNMTQIRSIYNIPTPNPSTNVVVGVISFGGGLYGSVDSNGVLTNGDAQAYWTSIGIPTNSHPKLIVVPINGATNSPNINDGGSTLENTLDVQTIGGACPSANLTIILYIAPNTLSSFYGVLNYAINTPVIVSSVSYKPTIVSISWGASEIYFDSTSLTNIKNLLQTATTNGVNICTATGDNGSNDGVGGTGAYCDFPSSCPYVTAVGGTNLVCPNNTYDNSTVETAWSSGGGGISTAYSKPSYQSAITASGRCIPDLAAVADPNTGVIYIVNGQTLLVGGTSVAAPIIAGFLATVKPSRFINPLIYSAPTNCTHDITSGSNGAYVAHAGYDNCTGLGTPNGINFVNAITFVGATSISISSSATTIQAGNTSQLTATVLPANASNKTVSWSSSNTAYATVNSSGLINAIAAGSVTITATTTDGSNLSAYCAVTVSPSTNPIPVTGITLNTTTYTLVPAQTYQLVATVAPNNASNKNVTWTSNSSNGSVSNNGLVTANNAGNFRITATTQDGGFTANANFTVTVPVTSVSLATTTYNLTVGQSATLVPTVLPNNATNKSVNYSSSNTSVATVNSSGVVSALNSGTSIVTVTTVDGQFTATATINVTTSSIKITRITLNAPVIQNLTVGQTFQTVATITPSNATNKTLSWTSSHSNIASVSNLGLVTAISNGSTIITATATDGSGKSALYTTTVTTNVTGVTLNLSTLTLARNATRQLVATVVPNTASNKAINWSSSNSRYVTVNNNGLVTAKRTGSATITATTAQGNFTARCVVTVT